MKHLFVLAAVLFGTIVCAPAQQRFYDASELTIIGKGMPTPHPYHRIDTMVYKGFSKSENQKVRCSAGLAIVFKTNSSRIDLAPVYALFEYHGASTPRVATERRAVGETRSRWSATWIQPRRSVCSICRITANCCRCRSVSTRKPRSNLCRIRFVIKS